MKKLLSSLLSDVGTVSMTRFLSLICVLSAVLISLTVILKEQPLDSAVGLVSVFLGAGFAGKVVQSFAEKGSDDHEEK